MYVGLHTASLPQVLAEARQRIVLHMALYAEFGRMPALAEALHTALTQPAFRRLQVITVPLTSRRNWVDEFLHALRPDLTAVQMEHEFAASRDFIVRLAARHEGLVEVYETHALPCAPCVIVDDRILFGHYAHSPVPMEQGFWFSVAAPMDDLFKWAETGALPRDATPRHRAAFRFVCDCRNAMRQAKRMLL
ncbi:hypothetical protein DA2_2848 [Desulfovibrio sp. A2]|nr:hypothetical protein DA2_2848 [Desulfovibrio sp. A2]